MLQIKEELEDAEVDMGPIAFQQVDSHYRTNQRDTIVIKKENAVANSNIAATLSRGVKWEPSLIKLLGEEVQKVAQATLTPVGAGSVKQSIHITVEGGNLVILPTVLQHRTNQNTSVKTENTIGSDCSDAMPCRRVKEKSVDKWADAGSNIYICGYCQKTFTKKTCISQHIICVHASGSYKCNQCERSFKCENYLKVHQAYTHTTLKKKCKVCGKKLTQYYLKRHLRMHDEKKLQCKICGANMTSKYSLHCHMNDIHQQQSIVSPFVKRCEYCQKIFSEERLKAHIRKMHKIGIHRCSTCKTDFKSEDCLWRHMKLVHSKDKHEDAGPNIYICDYCQKTFPKKFKIVAHITSVHASGSYKCDQCERSFKCKSYLKVHRGYMHTALKKQCNICGKKLRPNYLKLHMLRVHNNKKVQCKLCGALTSSNHSLHYHMNFCHSQQSLEHNQQSTSSNMGKESGENTHPPVGEVNAAASTQLQDVVVMKEEPAAEELELGPVVFQHMDCNYRVYKEEPLLDL